MRHAPRTSHGSRERHAELVATILAADPLAQKTKFRSAILQALEADCRHRGSCDLTGCGCPCACPVDGPASEEDCWCHSGGDCEVAWTIAEGRNIVPDAFRIARHVDNPDVTVFTAYEVEVSHRFTQDQLRPYLRWWWLLDATMRWDLGLIVVDRFGTQRVVDLALAALDDLRPSLRLEQYILPPNVGVA